MIGGAWINRENPKVAQIILWKSCPIDRSLSCWLPYTLSFLIEIICFFLLNLYMQCMYTLLLKIRATKYFFLFLFLFSFFKLNPNCFLVIFHDVLDHVSTIWVVFEAYDLSVTLLIRVENNFSYHTGLLSYPF